MNNFINHRSDNERQYSKQIEKMILLLAQHKIAITEIMHALRYGIAFKILWSCSSPTVF